MTTYNIHNFETILPLTDTRLIYELLDSSLDDDQHSALEALCHLQYDSSSKYCVYYYAQNADDFYLKHTRTFRDIDDAIDAYMTDTKDSNAYFLERIDKNSRREMLAFRRSN